MINLNKTRGTRVTIDALAAGNLSLTNKRKEISRSTDLAEIVEMGSIAFKNQIPDVENFFGPVQKLQMNGRIFYGIHKDQQTKVDLMSGGWEALRKAILADMGLDPDTLCIQVVGDSACYSEEGTSHNRNVLHENIPANSMLLWGFTGRIRNEGRSCDVNGLVNEMIDSDTEHWAGGCLANVVSYHTPHALRNWGCDGSSSVRHFWLVYGEDVAEDPSTKATFGEDVHSSDNISEQLISLEGGIQSLNQMLRCLEFDQPVIVSANTRGIFHEPSWVHSLAGKPLYRNGKDEVYHIEKKPSVDDFTGSIVYVDNFSDKVIKRLNVYDIRPHLALENRWYGNFFSVGGLSLFFQQKFSKESFSPELLAEWWREYAMEHLPANPKVHDFSTKQALLKDAEMRFMRVGQKLTKLVNIKCLN
ncbi:hypothetical protein N9Y92_04555 [Chlamydiales bacterium]|nr:hypothetical protein [Chlamydiales bacterium]